MSKRKSLMGVSKTCFKELPKEQSQKAISILNFSKFDQSTAEKLNRTQPYCGGP